MKTIGVTDTTEDLQTLNRCVAGMTGPAAIAIDQPVRLEADLRLPPGVTLVFRQNGCILGPFRLYGNETRIEAAVEMAIFALEVQLDGTWNAEFSPCWFGAVYDGETDCTSAIQKCLDQRGTIRLRGRGTACISRSLVIHGQTQLLLDPFFTLRLADHAGCTMLKTRWADQRYFETTFPAFVHDDPDFPGYAGPADQPENWVLGPPETHITIRGGIWDANGGNNPRESHLWGSFGYRGFLMMIVNVKGFVLRDATLFDPATYFFDAAVLSHFTIDNIHLDMRECRLNQDGIHLEGECYNGVISNIHGRTWDDMVALNGGDSWYPKYPPGVTAPPRGTGTNVLWRSFCQGGIRNIMIRDIHVGEGRVGYRAVRLLSTGKHRIDAVTIDGIYGTYTVDGVLISAHHEAVAPYGTIIVRNVNCTIAGGSDSAEHGRRGLFWLENDKVQVDTLIIDGCRFRHTPENGHFLYAQGSIRRLLVSNVDISLAPDTPCFGRGVFECVGDQAVIESASFANVSVRAEADSAFDVAFRGNWRFLQLANARIEAETVFALTDPSAVIQESNADYRCERLLAAR